MPGAIVVGVDRDDTSGPALSWAAEQARLTGDRLVLVHVVEPVPLLSPEVPALPPITKDEVQQIESSLRASTASLGVPSEVEVVLATAVGPALIEAAARHGARLVCVGHARSGLSRILLGSVANQVVRQCPVPVVVVRR